MSAVLKEVEPYHYHFSSKNSDKKKRAEYIGNTKNYQVYLQNQKWCVNKGEYMVFGSIVLFTIAPRNSFLL